MTPSDNKAQRLAFHQTDVLGNAGPEPISEWIEAAPVDELVAMAEFTLSTIGAAHPAREGLETALAPFQKGESE